MLVTWAEVFETGEHDYKDTTDGKLEAIADAFMAWANCHAGNKPPEKFGHGMVALYKFLGIAPHEDELTRLSDKLLEEKRKGA